MLLVRSFHMSRLLLMNFYKQVPKSHFKKKPTAKPSSSNTQGLLFFPLMLQVSTTHSGHRWASPRHLYVIPLRALACSLRPLVGSTVSWDATTVYRAQDKCSELVFPCRMQYQVSSLSDSDRKNKKSIFWLQQIHWPISQRQGGKDGDSKAEDGIWSSLALCVSRSISKEDPDSALLLWLLASFRRSRSGPAMHQVSRYAVWTVGTVPNYPLRNTKEGPKNTVKLYSFKCKKKKKDALGTFRLSTGSHDRAWEIPFLDLCREYSLACQWFHPLCMICHMQTCLMHPCSMNFRTE